MYTKYMTMHYTIADLQPRDSHACTLYKLGQGPTDPDFELQGMIMIIFVYTVLSCIVTLGLSKHSA